MKIGFVFSTILGLLLLVSCATSDKEFDREKVFKNEEFEKVVKIEKIQEPTLPEKAQNKSSSKKLPVKKEVTKKNKIKLPGNKKQSAKKKKAKKQIQSGRQKESQAQPKKTSELKVKKRLPVLEDSEGFDGRRPIVEPYRVGEEIVLGISYFAVEAGKFTMQVLPMVQVNGKKSYHFRYLIRSSPLFSMFYSVDDIAETFVDYESLLPYSYEIHVKESKQIRETRTFFDHKTRKATMWDRKQKKGGEVEKRKIEWDLKTYAQNVFSAAYYLRNFTLKVGKKLRVRVGHEGKNIEMTAEVLRKETIYTKAGRFKTFVVKPTFDIDGKFKPTGENYLWLTADDRKYIVRLESKIKIGTIVGEVQKLKK